jgi:hypothetical protein
LYYNGYVNRTIRNLDGRAYRALKALAAAEGKTLGEAITEAIQAYLARPAGGAASLSGLVPEDLGAGTETLSEDIDALVYGR